jgi:ABC-2 type transport system permease protein
LVIGAATLAGLGFAPRAAPTGQLGREFAHLTIYVPALALFLVVLPRIYGFSTLGRLTDMALFAVPFVLATSLRPRAASSGIARRPSWFSWRRLCHSFFSSGFPGRGR